MDVPSLINYSQERIELSLINYQNEDVLQRENLSISSESPFEGFSDCSETETSVNDPLRRVSLPNESLYQSRSYIDRFQGPSTSFFNEFDQPSSTRVNPSSNIFGKNDRAPNKSLDQSRSYMERLPGPSTSSLNEFDQPPSRRIYPSIDQSSSSQMNPSNNSYENNYPDPNISLNQFRSSSVSSFIELNFNENERALSRSSYQTQNFSSLSTNPFEPTSNNSQIKFEGQEFEEAAKAFAFKKIEKALGPHLNHLLDTHQFPHFNANDYALKKIYYEFKPPDRCEDILMEPPPIFSNTAENPLNFDRTIISSENARTSLNTPTPAQVKKAKDIQERKTARESLRLEKQEQETQKKLQDKQSRQELKRKNQPRKKETNTIKKQKPSNVRAIKKEKLKAAQQENKENIIVPAVSDHSSDEDPDSFYRNLQII